MAEPSASESSADSDQDFDPTAEMLVNDFDDEHTLEEEEAMESADSVTNELDDLQREGEIPLNELYAMYGYGSGPSAGETATSAGENGHCSTSKCSPVKIETVQAPLSPVPVKEVLMAPIPPPIVREEEIITVPDDTPDVPVGSGPLLRSVSQASESSETGTDDDYSPDDDWRKTIQIGSDYQAVIPQGLHKYDDAPAYENEDRLLWDPTKLPDQEVEEYLRPTQPAASAQGVNSIPVGNHIRDDEQALFLLQQCGHNMEEALRRRRMQPLHPADTMSLWSEDECRSFEIGLKAFGKDFHSIQQNKVRTRSVGELVQFYYLWKKTERHDVFASKNRLEKKKYSLHPGTTDYMDRFLDEQENPSTHRDRSSSPSMHSLMFGENKKRTPASSPPATGSKADAAIDHNLQQGTHPFLDVTYSTGVERSLHLQSSAKIHAGNPPSDCSKEFLNGEDRLTSTNSSKEKSVSLSSGLQTAHVENLSSHVHNDKNSLNPPNDVMSCARHSVESSRLHDTRAESCNTRFETRREEVTSIE